MTDCNNLCTAEKCAKLELEIELLKAQISELSNQIDNHISLDIPQAHDFSGDVKIESFLTGQELGISLATPMGNDTTAVVIPFCSDTECENIQIQLDNHISQDIPNAHQYNSNLKIEAFLTGNELGISISDVTSNDTTAVDLNLIEQQNNNAVNVDLAIEGNTLTIVVDVGDYSDFDSVELPDTDTPVNFDLSVEGNTLTGVVDVGNYSDFASVELPDTDTPVNFDLSVEGNTLTGVVDVGNYSDFASVELPVFEIDNLSVDVFNNGNNFEIKVAVENISDSDNFIINFPDMECDFTPLINLINDLGNQLNQLEFTIDTIDNNLKNVTDKVDVIDDAVTVDISGTINSNFSCTFPVDNDTNEPIPAYAEAESEANNYSGTGIAGIHETLKILANNIEAIYTESCRAIDPLLTILPADLYEFCGESAIDPNDYPDTEEGQIQYNDAVALYLQSKLAESKYGYLLKNANSSSLITAPSNWINPIISDFSLIQARINKTQICQIDEAEPIDVVSIVASPKYITNISNSVLILHFVTLDNYPKRSSNSTYRPIQIPAPKTSYDWDLDFKNLRWHQGNQYGELQLEGYKAKVSGWFENATRANEYFDAVLNLTTATEKNRVVPIHSNPQTSIPVRETRPYRAFISSVGTNGEATTLTKYMPLDNEP